MPGVESMNKQTSNKTQWVTVEKLREHYDLSPSYAYQLVNAKDFPVMRLGTRRGIRVDLNKTDEYFEKHFNNS